LGNHCAVIVASAATIAAINATESIASNKVNPAAAL
jgi:hypothetical protein